jgi:hypothetical protein
MDATDPHLLDELSYGPSPEVEKMYAGIWALASGFETQRMPDVLVAEGEMGQ